MQMLNETPQVEAPVAEPASTDSVQPEQFISKAQSIGDTLEADKVVDKPLDTEESGETEDVSDDEIDSMIEEVLSEETSSEDESSEETLPEPEEESGKSSNVQKRIDELTAAKKAALEELAEAKSKLAEIETPKAEDPKPKSDRISDAELTGAIKDFIEEGDADGIMNVINYKLKLQKEDLTNDYRKEQQEAVSQVARKQKEWQTVIKDFSPESYEQESLQTNSDFDIRNKESKLYKLADDLFTKNGDKYNADGGMRKAVEKAFQTLLIELLSSKKRTKPSKEVEGLQNRLSKEQRKKTIGEGASSVSDPKTNPKKKISDLDEAIGERRRFKNARSASSM